MIRRLVRQNPEAEIGVRALAEEGKKGIMIGADEDSYGWCTRRE